MALNPLDAPFDASAFKAVFRQHPAGVTLVSVPSTSEPTAFTVSSVISVSAEPPILAFSANSTTSFFAALQDAPSVAISFLSTAQSDVAQDHAHRITGPHQQPRWHQLPTGEHVTVDGVAWIQGKITERIPMGSSHLISVAVTGGGILSGDPLVYHHRGYHRTLPLTESPGTGAADNVTELTIKEHLAS